MTPLAKAAQTISTELDKLQQERSEYNAVSTIDFTSAEKLTSMRKGLLLNDKINYLNDAMSSIIRCQLIKIPRNVSNDVMHEHAAFNIEH